MNSPTAAKCLELLAQAKTDNEKLAALLLIPSILPASTIEGEEQLSFKKSLVQNLDFQFLLKLLNQKSDSAEAVGLQTVSLSVISCLCDQNVLQELQLSQVLNRIEGLLLESQNDKPESVDNEDSLTQAINKRRDIANECLQELVKLQTGAFVENTLLPVFYTLFTKIKSPGKLTCFPLSFGNAAQETFCSYGPFSCFVSSCPYLSSKAKTLHNYSSCIYIQLF